MPFCGKYIPKITNFGDLGAVSPRFKAKAVKSGVRVQTWETVHSAKFCKNRLRRYTPLAKCIPKNTNFDDLGAVSPHCKSDNSEIWREDTDLGTPSPALNFVKKNR